MPGARLLRTDASRDGAGDRGDRAGGPVEPAAAVRAGAGAAVAAAPSSAAASAAAHDGVLQRERRGGERQR